MSVLMHLAITRAASVVQQLRRLYRRPSAWLLLLVGGIATYAVGVAMSSVLTRHNDVVAVAADRLCDQQEAGFALFGDSCYSIRLGEFVPPLPTLPIAARQEGCFVVCGQSALARPPGAPIVDVWTTSDRRVLVASVAGRLHATPAGYVIWYGTWLIPFALVLTISGVLVHRRRHTLTGAADKVAEVAGTVPLLCLTGFAVFKPSSITDPLGAALGATFLLGLLTALTALIIGSIKRRRARHPATGGRPWMSLSAAVVVIVINITTSVFGWWSQGWLR